jgi:hypothetical protein
VIGFGSTAVGADEDESLEDGAGSDAVCTGTCSSGVAFFFLSAYLSSKQSEEEKKHEE